MNTLIEQKQAQEAQKHKYHMEQEANTLATRIVSANPKVQHNEARNVVLLLLLKK